MRKLGDKETGSQVTGQTLSMSMVDSRKVNSAHGQ